MQNIGKPGFITRPQYDYICDLLEQKNLFANQMFFDTCNAMDAEEFARYLTHLREVTIPNMSRTGASGLIDKLKVLPKKEAATSATTHGGNADVRATWAPEQCGGTLNGWAMSKGDLLVPRGSYAIDTRDGAINDTMFVSVWIADDGSRWSVKRYESDSRVFMPRSQQYDVLERIVAADPAQAAMRYGLEIGKCGICGRGLTNDTSRERGIGPICAERWGW